MNTTLLIKHGTEYWTNELQLPLPGFHMYTDYPAIVAGRTMQSLDIVLDSQASSMNSISQKYDINTWMLSSYIVFLYRISGDKDLLIGVKDNKGGVLPLRVVLSGTETFQEVYELVALKQKALEETELVLTDLEELIGQSLTIHTLYGDEITHKHSGLNWSVQQESADRWLLHISYAEELFKASTIQKFSANYLHLCNALFEDMNISISRISLVTPEDTAAYVELNNTKKHFAIEHTITSILAQAVGKFPERIALSFGDQQLTYRELDSLSNHTANMLISKGLRKGEYVSIFMERGLNTIISLFGIIKAGGAYVPLDPTHPDERNAYIISDTKSGFILTQHEFTAKLDVLLSDFGTKPVMMYPETNLLAESEESLVMTDIHPDDIAYIIYTSGSTGKPKGAIISHKGVVNLGMAIQDQLKMNEEDIIIQYSTFSFDASVYDLFGSIASGSRLHLLADEERFSIDSFTAAVKETGATRIALLPTVFFNQLATYLPENETSIYRNIKSIVVGGEGLPGETVRMFQKKLSVPIVNVYGPTEITAVATGHVINYELPEHIATVCIGKPLANYELFVVDENNELCPTCVTGELLISSIGVAKGYLNQPEKTREVFIPDPITPDSGRTVYRTGDLVRLLPNGEVEYRGRKDSQVKIRGFRIEIGEIEDNLAKHDLVKEIAVIARPDADGIKILVGFYTTNDGQVIPHSELVQFLSKKVPNYMIPKYFSHLEQMPLSPTGKMDRKKLALFEINIDHEDATYEAPENELQKQVSLAWEKALGQTRIGIHDDFFEIGGYSLKILEILVILKPHYPQLKINDFFVYPTIAKLSERIEEIGRNNSIQETTGFADLPIQDLIEYPLTFGTAEENTLDLSKQTNILLTGATGYLGSHLLYELLLKTDAVLYCLVRPSGEQGAFERLVQVMTGYFGSSIAEIMEKRVLAIQGDLSQDNLGFSEADRMLIDKLVDSIVHCGADVKHFGESEHFASVNVESTRRLLKLAKSKPNTRFHFISTLGIPEDLAFNGQWDSITKGTGYETSFIENVYTNSKLEAEKLVVKYGEEEGVPASIYRVGNLSCHSDSGVFQKNIDSNAFYRMLKAMLLLEKTPNVRWEVDLTPINYAGEAIIALALQEETVGKVFHICNPVTISYEQMVGHFKNFGYDITLLELQEFESWLLNPEEPKDQAGLELAMAQLEGDGAKNSLYRFACPQTVQYLENTGVSCAEPDHTFFHKLINHAVNIGYFPKNK
ncbi:non-ribosomal peptide synthetase [Paenibacillus sp. Marseille-Q4541]|uniref:non-ribosomal peptide synthetase family protein n=1 Tax=Paenibacillus sp. Marseille-Q4541 TaxID=2831522 RepID=UPI001BA6478C|nr:non-ribosomal peptide synthetase [Paenibacillus sp. Marseille-Q4541]